MAKFPGSAYAGATSLVYHGVALTGDLIPWLRHLHDQYGEVVRITPNTLSFISPASWNDIYGHRSGGKKPNRKDSRVAQARDTNGVSSLFSEPDDAEHGRMRRIFSHAFSDKALGEQQVIFSRYTTQLIDNIRRGLESNPDQEFDAVKLYNFTTFDIMGDLTFGEPLGLLKNSAYSAWVASIFQGLKAVAVLQILWDHPALYKLFLACAPASFREANETHFRHSAERVDRRLKVLQRDQPDIWNLVINQPEGRRLTPAQMHANADVFMLAGTETTATLLSGLTYYLLQNPDKMGKLVGEIRGCFKTEDELTIEALQRLKYMAACLNEGFRCYPPVPQSGPPRLTPAGGNIICGQWVPGNVNVAQKLRAIAFAQSTD